jgi:hypothetical protein
MTLDHRCLFLLDQSAFEKAFTAIDVGENTMDHPDPGAMVRHLKADVLFKAKLDDVLSFLKEVHERRMSLYLKGHDMTAYDVDAVKYIDSYLDGVAALIRDWDDDYRWVGVEHVTDG